MTEMAKEEFVRQISAMTDEEKRLVVSLIPTEVICDEIQERVKRLNDVVTAVKEAVNNIPTL